MQQVTPKYAHALLRFAFPEFTAGESDVKGLKGVDRILSSALHCDVYTLPWDFYTSIEATAKQRPANAIQGLKAIAFLKQRGCAFDHERIEYLSQLLVPAVQGIAGSFGPLSNIRIEAMIVLLQTGGLRLVKPEWIAEVYLAQRDDGTLNGVPLRSLLAAYLFLEYASEAGR